MTDFGIYLVPEGISSINSRSDVDLRSDFHGLYPIFSSPMKGISGSRLVIEMGKNNCLGILHRFESPEQRVKNIHEVAKQEVKFGVAIGVNNFDVELDIATCAFEKGAVLLCVDLANGYLERIKKVGRRLIARFGDDIALMSGNIVSKEGAYFLQQSGFGFARVGIGGSKVCTTRVVTGIGRNNLVAIEECSDRGIGIVADGGIDEPGKAVKAFAVGADFIMMGSALAYACESEGTDTIYGMASSRLHREENKLIKSIEGTEVKIDPSKKVPLKEILDQFLWGMRSACTYLGCKSYKDIPHSCKIVLENELLDKYNRM